MEENKILGKSYKTIFYKQILMLIVLSLLFHLSLSIIINEKVKIQNPEFYSNFNIILTFSIFCLLSVFYFLRYKSIKNDKIIIENNFLLKSGINMGEIDEFRIGKLNFLNCPDLNFRKNHIIIYVTYTNRFGLISLQIYKIIENQKIDLFINSLRKLYPGIKIKSFL